MYSIDVITKSSRHRRKKYISPRHYQSNHYRQWLSARGAWAEVGPIPTWEPPKYHFFFKLSGPDKSLKVNDKTNFMLIPSLLDIPQGQVYITNPTGSIRIIGRPTAIKPIYTLDGEKWHDVTIAVLSRPVQPVNLPKPYVERMKDLPNDGDHLHVIYHPKERRGAIQSYSKGNYGNIIKNFTAPYYHFDTCIKCQNETHQIGYVLANGPHFATINRLGQHSEEISGQILNYYIDKVVCAKTDRQLSDVTQHSFLLKVEILSIKAEKDICPDYCMVIGRVRGYSAIDLYPGETEFTAKNVDESDGSLFNPGTYIYIDHYHNPEHQPVSEFINPYNSETEFGQICYFIGPKTHPYGAFPIRPFS